MSDRRKFSAAALAALVALAAPADAGYGDQSAHQGHKTEETAQEGHQGHEHAGHDAHAGHAMTGGAPVTPSGPPPAPQPVAVPSGQPAKTLSAGPLDAPAASSVVEAQRSAAMAAGMAGHGHGGHGASNYRHVDAGRGPEAYEGSEKQTPGGDGHQHQGMEHGEETAQESAVYACPMHPEVTSATPGTCSKCGMDLVERREG